MASSIFLVDYNDGLPDITYEEIIVYDEETESLYGGWSVLEEVEDPNQEDVKIMVVSSVEKLTLLKSKPSVIWVEDIEGW